MKILITTLAMLVGLGVAVNASAQTTPQTQITSTSNSQVQSGSSSGANAQTNGNAQQIEFNSSSPTHTSERVTSMAPIALGSFGTSFSSNNCSNTTAASITVMGFGGAAGKAVQEQSCAFIVQGTAMGNLAQHFMQKREVALSHNDYPAAQQADEIARKWEAMAGFDFCKTSDENVEACKRLGLVTAVHDEDGKVAYAPVGSVDYGTRQQRIAEQQQHQRQVEATQEQQQQQTAAAGTPWTPPRWTNYQMVPASH